MEAQSKYINNSSVIMTFMQRGWTDTNEMNGWLLENEHLEFDDLIKAIPSKNSKDDFTNFGEHSALQEETEAPPEPEHEPEQQSPELKIEPQQSPESKIEYQQPQSSQAPTILVQDGNSAFKAKASAALDKARPVAAAGARAIASGTKSAAKAVAANSKSIFEVVKLILVLIIAAIALILLLKILSVASGGIEFIDNALDSSFSAISNIVDGFSGATGDDWADAGSDFINDVGSGNIDGIVDHWWQGIHQIFG